MFVTQFYMLHSKLHSIIIKEFSRQVGGQDPFGMKLFHYSIAVDVLALVVVFAYSKSGELSLHVANNIILKPVCHFITLKYLFHPFTTT